MGTLWLAVSCIIFLASVCAFGYMAGVEPVPDGEGVLTIVAWLTLTTLTAFAWPLLLALAIVTSPGWIAYLIGRKVRKRV